MAALPYIQLYVADYLADTAHLSTEENGAYLLLIFNYWQRGKALNNANERLATICRLGPDAWARAKAVIAEFFDIDGDVWTHRRIEADWEAVASKSQKAKSANAQRTFNGRGTNAQRTFNHTDTDKEADTDKEDLSTSNEVDVGIFDPDTQQDETEDSTRAKDEAQPAGGQAPADRNPCPLKRIVELYHELLPELPRVEKLTKARVGYVQQRWREDLPSVDSWRAYFADVRNSKFLMGKSQGRDGKPPFRADLEWLIRPGNFAKVAEGKYHS